MSKTALRDLAAVALVALLYLWLDLVSYSHLRSRMAGDGRERRR